MARRITSKTLASGQQMPYGDDIHLVRVRFEADPFDKGEWMPDPLYVAKRDICGGDDTCVSTRVVATLYALNVGFTSRTRKDVAWHEVYLEYLIEVTPGLWEFQTRSAYTD